MNPDADRGPDRRRYRVRGIVQGVGFRAWVIRRARRLEVRGTVRNCADGSVEVEAAGEQARLDQLEALLDRGPPLARVSAVTRLDPTTNTLPRGFEVIF